MHNPYEDIFQELMQALQREGHPEQISKLDENVGYRLCNRNAMGAGLDR